MTEFSIDILSSFVLGIADKKLTLPTTAQSNRRTVPPICSTKSNKKVIAS